MKRLKTEEYLCSLPVRDMLREKGRGVPTARAPGGKQMFLEDTEPYLLSPGQGSVWHPEVIAGGGCGVQTP